MSELTVRSATPADFPRINDIYNWTILDNHVSFDTEPWTVERRIAWWEARDPELDCLVGVASDAIVGVAYSSWYRPKQAYRTSVETTIVLDTAHLRKGHGSRLLSALLDRLSERGFHRAIAIVAEPNPGSIVLHHRLGYQTVGTLSEVGRKSDRYWDTTILERDLTTWRRRTSEVAPDQDDTPFEI